MAIFPRHQYIMFLTYNYSIKSVISQKLFTKKKKALNDWNLKKKTRKKNRDLSTRGQYEKNTPIHEKRGVHSWPQKKAIQKTVSIGRN